MHPARLARGLRRVLLKRGVRIFEHTPVRRLRPGLPVQVETSGGSVRAGRAVLAVGCWGIHWPQLRPYVAVRGSFMVVTESAPERLAEIRWTGGESLRDLRTALRYARTTPDGRIAFGVAGLQPGLATTIGPRFSYHERFAHITTEQLRRMFPAFRDVPIAAAWGGAIDVASTSLPFFGSLPPGNVHYGLGFTGNGVGPSHLAGKILARLAFDPGISRADLRVVGHCPKRFPPEPLRSLGALLVNDAILRKDAAEDARRRPNPLVGLVAGLPRRLGYNLGP